MGKACRYLTAAEIDKINQAMVTKFGGQYHLRSLDSLVHMVEEVQGSLFGEELYPGVFQKAAFLLHRIIQGHFFFDGNKRTGVESCKLFLAMNGYILTAGHSELVDIAKKTANKEIDKEALSEWLKCKTILNR